MSSDFYKKYNLEIGKFIDNAIDEDIGGIDHSNMSLYKLNSNGTFGIYCNESCVIAGLLLTKKIIERIGGIVDIKPDEIIIKQLVSNKIPDQIVESDWSSASYFYSLVALSDSSDITLSSFFNNSIQGDSRIVDLYKQFGVETKFINDKIYLKKNNIDLPDSISINLRDNPDLAQTIVVTCLGLGVNCKLEGLHTLKLKETDRLLALKREIEKFERK